MEIRFDVYFKKNLGTLFKSNEVDLDGIPAYTNLDLNLVNRLEANYKVGTQKYTDNVSVFSIEERVIQIPFKSDVVRVGLNEFEIVAYMKNGDIKVSQTYTYNIDEAIGEGVVSGGSGDGHSHTNLAILNSITQSKINEWNNKAEKEHEHDYAEKNHTHNANEIEGLELKEGPQGPKGDKGDKGEQGIQGISGTTPNISIGNVNTLEPGQNATVTRRGTDANPIFDFGIPRGEKGEGSTGGNVSNNSSKVIFDYVHKDSRVIQPTSLDLATGIFTCDNVSFTGTCNIKLNTFSMNGVPKELGIHNNITDIVKLSDTTFTIKCGGTNLTSYESDSAIDLSTFCFTPPASVNIQGFDELENGAYTLCGFGTRGRAGQTIIKFLDKDGQTVLQEGAFADGKPIMFISFETKIHIQNDYKSSQTTVWVAHNNISGTSKGFGFFVSANTRAFNYTDKKITSAQFASAFNDGFRFILTKEV